MLPAEEEQVISVSEFVALLNQTLEYAFPNVIVTGELANLRVSKGKWVYFDLKDDTASVKFFGTVYQLPGPLEDGMLMKVRGVPKLHELYGFSITVQTMQPTGEGAIRRAADLLRATLAKEGLFDDLRKRPIPYPPTRIGLITSSQSAAYADFIKIINARWAGLTISLVDVQVQGEIAAMQVCAAIETLNSQALPPQVIVIIRGGGSADDLAAFSTESVTRAVAASRIPTMVAIGHEIDVSLAELAADRRASTPSNAAELLVPDKRQVLADLRATRLFIKREVEDNLLRTVRMVELQSRALAEAMTYRYQFVSTAFNNQKQLLAALNPELALKRGFAIVSHQGKAVRSTSQLRPGGIIQVRLIDGSFEAAVIDRI